MSTFSVDGLVSGLNTTTLVNQLMQIERIPQQRLQQNLAKQNSTVTAYQSLATRLKAVETAATALQADAAWGARSVAVAGTSVRATASAGATTGTSSITVGSLATAATWTTDAAYGLDDVVSDGSAITVRNAAGSDVTVTPATGSLRDVVAAINNAPDSGLTAIAVKVGDGSYRLQLRASETGTQAAPQSITGLSAPLTQVAANNASYTVDGISGTSQTNTVADLLPGLTVTFAQTGTSSVAVAADSTGTVDAMQSLVDAVNKALDEVAAQTVKDATSPRGPLASDTRVRAITTDLLRAVSDAFGTRTSSEIGLQTTRDGKLTLDRAVFTDAVTRDPTATRLLVAPATGVSVAERMRSVVTAATDPVSGTITFAVQGRERTVKDLQTQIDSWDRRLELRRANLNRQFSGLEVALQRLQSQGSFLGGALNNLSASNQ